MAKNKSETRQPPWSGFEVEVLSKLASTHSAERIAGVLGRTESAVRSKAKKLKIRLEKYGEHRLSAKYSNDHIKQVILLVKQGYNQREISEQTGITQPHVANIRIGRSRWRETMELR